MRVDTSLSLKEKVIEKLKGIYDPEIPIDIYSLGLIYDIKLTEEEKRVAILMTLTTPSCPAADFILSEVRSTLVTLPEIAEVDIEITFDPPYSMERITEEGRAMLGIGLGDNGA